MNTRPLDRRIDSASGRPIVTLKPGEYHASASGELIGTVLGSCIAVCLYDRAAGVGGMNHFMLPVQLSGAGAWGDIIATPARYGVAAMELLINDMLKLGASRANFEAKVFGGARVLSGMSDIGRSNIDFVRGFCERERIPVVRSDVGGERPRQLICDTLDGRVLMRYLQRAPDVATRERDYLNNPRPRPQAGEVDLF